MQNIIKDTENVYTRSHFSVLLLTFSFFRPLQQMGYWAIYKHYKIDYYEEKFNSNHVCRNFGDAYARPRGK